MIINHNMSAQFADRMTGITTDNLQKDMEKLASGDKLTKAGLGASDLAISEKMRAQIRGFNKAAENVENGISFLQVSEGFLNETTDILQRIRELAVQSSNGIYSDSDRAQIQVEVSQLVAEVDRIASQAQFNGMNMLTGRFADGSMQIQIGANADQNMKIAIGTMTAQALGLKGGQDTDSKISLSTSDEANAVINTIDNALNKVLKQRADLGAYQNRGEMAVKGIDIAAENTQAAESRIRDADIASTMVDFTKNQVLQQSGIAMLAQANSSHASVLNLLK